MKEAAVDKSKAASVEDGYETGGLLTGKCFEQQAE